MMNYRSVAFISCLLFTLYTKYASADDAKSYLLSSPDAKLTAAISLKDTLQYSISLNGKTVLLPSKITMQLTDRSPGVNPVVLQAKRNSVRSTLHPLYGKASELSNYYNELVLELQDNYSVVFRAYNEAITYRFITRYPDSITVVNERADFNVPNTSAAIFPETTNFSAWELSYINYKSIAAIEEGKRAITPALFSQDDIKLVIAESDLLDYPGMYLQKHQGSLRAEFAKYPSKTELGSWGNFVSVVKERNRFIARTAGSRNFPWRIVFVTDDDKDLLNNQLVYKLASPSKIRDTKWIVPGKAAWEWWHDALLPGAPIPSGMPNRNTALYNYYIDFAASNHLEYLMIDAGWSDNYNLLKPTGRMDVQQVINHGKSKNVKVFLWCVATTLMKDLDANMDYLQSLGAAGIKVDFIDRDDQEAIGWFELIAKAAAKRKLMVNFHGCSKPTGLQRTYPNIINYEAVRGAECSKWDYSANPDQHLLTPFIRMLAGPMDYTPGSMRNRSKETFKPIDPGLPSTQGTRCHELAMFVIFDQPLAMLCDSPTEYEKYPDIMKFLSAVPTDFQETKVLKAKVGDYAVMAKRKNKQWFIGAMTNWDSRTVEVDFSFLPDHKTYQLNWYSDAADADLNASNYSCKTIKVTKQTKLRVNLAKGGGAVGFLSL